MLKVLNADLSQTMFLDLMFSWFSHSVKFHTSKILYLHLRKKKHILWTTSKKDEHQHLSVWYDRKQSCTSKTLWNTADALRSLPMKKLPCSTEKQNRSYQTLNKLWAAEHAGQYTWSSMRATLYWFNIHRSSIKPIMCIQTPIMARTAETSTFKPFNPGSSLHDIQQGLFHPQAFLLPQYFINMFEYSRGCVIGAIWDGKF